MKEEQNKPKLYFRNEDENYAYPLKTHLRDAKDEELSEVGLFEAIPKPYRELGYRWCSLFATHIENTECNKNDCIYWREGRGSVCRHRGHYHEFGEYLVFDVETGKIKNKE